MSFRDHHWWRRILVPVAFLLGFIVGVLFLAAWKVGL